ncbi:MAG: GNAT family N-acetyltransferase [Rhodoblastus sp.]
MRPRASTTRRACCRAWRRSSARGRRCAPGARSRASRPERPTRRSASSCPGTSIWRSAPAPRRWSSSATMRRSAPRSSCRSPSSAVALLASPCSPAASIPISTCRSCAPASRWRPTAHMTSCWARPALRRPPSTVSCCSTSRACGPGSQIPSLRPTRRRARASPMARPSAGTPRPFSSAWIPPPPARSCAPRRASSPHWAPLTYERATDLERAHTILEAFVDQKTLRFSQKNRDPGFAHVAVRAFLDAMSSGRCGGPVALEFYALSVGDRIVATYGGLPRGRGWHGLVNSFNVDPQIARSSPAELLLRHIIRDLARRGFERFDLGVGESRYKNAICDEEIELADLVLPCSRLGALWAPIERRRLAAKRWVKKTPWALSFVEQMRAGPA